jgi:hypothetical protein
MLSRQRRLEGFRTNGRQSFPNTVRQRIRLDADTVIDR